MSSLNHPVKCKQKYCKWQVYRKLREFSDFPVNYLFHLELVLSRHILT